MLYESVPGQVAVKASVSVSERPPIKGCNDVAVDRFGQACRFLASFRLPFALRGSSGEAITDEAWGLGPGEVRWHTVRSREPELPTLKVRFFIGAWISFSNVRCNSDNSIYTQSILATSTRIRTSASRRFV